MNKNVQRGLLAVGALVAAGAAHADPAAVDLSAVTAAGTTIATVGGAVFAIHVGIKLYKWITRAL